MQHKLHYVLIAYFLTVSLWSSFNAEAKTPAPPAAFNETGKVVKVVDGDTIDVEVNGTIMRLRLIGMDTPEVVDPRKPVECFGREASDQAKKLLTGKTVKLEADPSQQNRDRYNRFLRYVWIDGKVLFNYQMIADGYAFEYTFQGNAYKYQKEFKQTQKEAEQKQKGLWHPDTCAGESKPADAPAETSDSKFSCSPKKTCGQMSSCEEAYYHLNVCGNKSLDRDKDGVPCESICPGG